MKNSRYSKHDQKLWIGIGISCVILVFAFLFLFNAMGVADFYPHFAALPNVLAKYIVVILTFTTAIMSWSNIALAFEDEKARKGLTIAMTAFAFIMTVPLTYVFFSLLAFNSHYTADQVIAAAGAAAGAQGLTPAEATKAAEVLNLNVVDGVMGTHSIYLGFVGLFKGGAGLWAILIIMSILGVVFLLEPLIAGICVCNGKILNIVGADDNGKKGLLKVATLPVIKKQREEEAIWIKEHIV